METRARLPRKIETLRARAQVLFALSMCRTGERNSIRYAVEGIFPALLLFACLLFFFFKLCFRKLRELMVFAVYMFDVLLRPQGLVRMMEGVRVVFVFILRSSRVMFDTYPYITGKMSFRRIICYTFERFAKSVLYILTRRKPLKFAYTAAMKNPQRRKYRCMQIYDKAAARSCLDFLSRCSHNVRSSSSLFIYVYTRVKVLYNSKQLATIFFFICDPLHACRAR